MRRKTAIPFQPQVVFLAPATELAPRPRRKAGSCSPPYGAVRPRNDSVSWRVALLAAGLDVLHHDWPKSAQWPVVFAGISGGAKCAQWVGAILAQTHSLNICGFFLTGINEDQMPEALKTNPSPPGFLHLPIWISSGINDRIATPAQEQQVKGSLVRTGFQNVQLSRFSGGHEVNRADLQSALKWFREQGHF
jgi:hypothetical protein